MRHERGKRPTKPAAERYTIRGTDETNPERSDVVREARIVAEGGLLVSSAVILPSGTDTIA